MFLSLFLSCLLFSGIFCAAWHKPRLRWGAAILVTIAGFVVLLLSPIAFFQGLLTIGLLALVDITQFLRSKPFCPQGRNVYLGLLPALIIGMYVFVLVGHHQRTQRRRKEYPFESVQSRIPLNKLNSATPSPEETRFQQTLQTRIQEGTGEWRTQRLKMLHEDSIRHFINAQGFGVSRAMSDYYLETWEDRTITIPQNSINPSLTWSTAEFARLTPRQPIEEQQEVHENSYLGFVYPEGFGYVQDRDHVAGFEPHGFAKVTSPLSMSIWQLQRLELVSLLLHDNPVVYESDHLPKMKKAKEYPTRPLTPFEEAGLKAIQNGELLYVRENEKHLLMMGSLRAVEQCTKCHGCEKGDLLGAFSYSFVRE